MIKIQLISKRINSEKKYYCERCFKKEEDIITFIETTNIKRTKLEPIIIDFIIL